MYTDCERNHPYQEIQNRDSALGELKSQIDSILKSSETNMAILDWIGDRKEDPEPLHETIRERTGVSVTSSTGGNWFLETSEFTSWVDGIRQNTTGKRVFWLKGSSRCSKCLFCLLGVQPC